MLIGGRGHGAAQQWDRKLNFLVRNTERRTTQHRAQLEDADTVTAVSSSSFRDLVLALLLLFMIRSRYMLAGISPALSPVSVVV